MTPSDRTEQAIAAPSHLVTDTRVEFRRAALEALDTLPEQTGRLVIDLSLTRMVDSTGLGSLILIQQHASSRGLVVRLRGLSEEVRLLLELTKLLDRFEIEHRAPS